MVSITDMSDSVKIKYAIKHLSKDAAVGECAMEGRACERMCVWRREDDLLLLAGGAKLGLLCELYTRNKKEMSKSDKREVLDYLRARLAIQLLHGLQRSLSPLSQGCGI